MKLIVNKKWDNKVSLTYHIETINVKGGQLKHPQRDPVWTITPLTASDDTPETHKNQLIRSILTKITKEIILRLTDWCLI